MSKGWWWVICFWVEAFNDGKVGGVHRSRSASGGKTIEGSFEVVLVGSELGR